MQISNEFSHTCVFSYEKSIIILVNSTLSELTVPIFRNRIGIILRESLMKAGISPVCSDLTRTLKIYLENDRNLAQTSQLLDIHRSTLLYRIGRIKEI